MGEPQGMNRLLLTLLVAYALDTSALPATDSKTFVSIFKVGYPIETSCGQEPHVEKSLLNPHYFFPIKFGGFKEGLCADVGYSVFERNDTVAMNPFPGIHHNLTFELYNQPK